MHSLSSITHAHMRLFMHSLASSLMLICVYSCTHLHHHSCTYAFIHALTCSITHAHLRLFMQSLASSLMPLCIYSCTHLAPLPVLMHISLSVCQFVFLFCFSLSLFVYLPLFCLTLSVLVLSTLFLFLHVCLSLFVSTTLLFCFFSLLGMSEVDLM